MRIRAIQTHILLQYQQSCCCCLLWANMSQNETSTGHTEMLIEVALNIPLCFKGQSSLHLSLLLPALKGILVRKRMWEPCLTWSFEYLVEQPGMLEWAFILSTNWAQRWMASFWADWPTDVLPRCRVPWMCCLFFDSSVICTQVDLCPSEQEVKSCSLETGLKTSCYAPMDP